jgi:hypothetical protein
MDPDVYDTLELVAEAYGGIGGGSYHDGDGPCCSLGIAAFASADHLMSGPVSEELMRLCIFETENDAAVRRVTGVSGHIYGLDLTRAGRIPFSDWCAALGVVRGEG